MRPIISSLCILIILIGNNANAYTQHLQVDVGGVKINVQAPVGFHEISELSPDTRKLAETMTPRNNRLLAVFVSEEDLGRIMKGDAPMLERYMFLQVLRKLENSKISNAQFQQVVSRVKEQQNLMHSKMKEIVSTFLESASEKISTEYERSLEMKIGEPVPLGVFIEKPNAIGFASMVKYQLEEEGEKLDHVVVGGSSIILARGKMLYAYVYSTYKDREDLNWVRLKSKEWVNSLLMSEIMSTTTGGSYDNTWASGIDWEQVISKAIGGGMAGGILVLIIGVFRGAQRLFIKKRNDL